MNIPPSVSIGLMENDRGLGYLAQVSAQLHATELRHGVNPSVSLERSETIGVWSWLRHQRFSDTALTDIWQCDKDNLNFVMNNVTKQQPGNRGG